MSYTESLEMPISVLKFLFEVREKMEFEQRAKATSDQATAAGAAYGKEGVEALAKHIASLETLATGNPSTDLDDDTERIDL